MFAHRRRELAAEGEAQGLSDGDLAALDAELIASLHDEAGAETPEAPPAPATAGLVPVAVGAALAVAVSWGLYALWGEPGAPVLARAGEVLRDPNASEDTLEALADALSARLGRRPHDGSSLFHLGHLKLRMRDFEGAAETLAALRTLTPEAEVEAAWAQARYLADGGRLGPEARLAVDRVLAAEPGHPMMLELLAMDAMQRGAPSEASGYLGRLLKVTPAGPRRDLFGAALALAHQRMGAGAEESAVRVGATGDSGSDAGDAAVAGGVPVAVSVSPGIGAHPGAPVFVIARAEVRRRAPVRGTPADGGGPAGAARAERCRRDDGGAPAVRPRDLRAGRPDRHERLPHARAGGLREPSRDRPARRGGSDPGHRRAGALKGLPRGPWRRWPGVLF